MAQNNNREGGTSNRGFASMDSERQREIASMGGKAAHEKGTAHRFDSREAQEAGRKGGKASHGNQSQERSQEQDSFGSDSGLNDQDIPHE